MLAAEPNNVSALNGMANVYLIAKDYDRASKLGETLFTTASNYGAAIYDYTMALEGLLEKTGEDTRLLQRLDRVYQHLQTLIRRPEQKFTAAHVAYFEQHAEAVRHRLARGANDAP